MSTILTLSTGTSRGRETEGYAIVRLRDESSNALYRCMGGGYDMVGTVFADWLQDAYQDALRRIGRRAYYIGTTVQADGLYGMRFRPDGSVTLDGACGLESMRRIAEAISLDVRTRVSPRGRTLGFVVEELDTESSASRQHFIDTGRYLPKGAEL